MPNLTLIARDGRTPERSVELNPAETNTVGRSPDNRVVLNDPKVSRTHLRLVWRDGACWAGVGGERALRSSAAPSCAKHEADRSSPSVGDPPMHPSAWEGLEQPQSAGQGMPLGRRCSSAWASTGVNGICSGVSTPRHQGIAAST